MSIHKLSVLVSFLVFLIGINRIQPVTATERPSGPKPDRKLQARLEKLLQTFHGTAGIYVYHCKHDRFAAVQADTLFPTASIVKVPIMVGLFDKIERGDLNYYAPLYYRDSLQYGGSGLMQFFKDSTKTNISTLASLMISYSDNTTSLWLQDLVGGGTAINKLLEKYGLQQTRVNSRTEGREDMRTLYGWGQTTPKEMTKLLLLIRQGKIVSKSASEKMYRLMSNVVYQDYALSQIPPYINVASKQGMVDASRSELVMVNAPKGDYVFYLATKHNEDQRWQTDNEAWELARKVSALLWNYYEKDPNWKASAKAARYSE